MRSAEQDPLSWRKSSRSDPTECMELAWPADFGTVRDSKNVGGPVLLFDRVRFAEFMVATKANVFNQSWRKSSWSDPVNCVELAWPASVGAVRDSKNAGGPVLLFDRARFAEFVVAAKADGFGQ